MRSAITTGRDPVITTVEKHSVYGSIFRIGCSPMYFERHMDQARSTKYDVLPGSGQHETFIRTHMTRAKLRQTLFYYIDFEAYVTGYLRSAAADAPANEAQVAFARKWYAYFTCREFE
jgi:hypothetical protein